MSAGTRGRREEILVLEGSFDRQRNRCGNATGAGEDGGAKRHLTGQRKGGRAMRGPGEGPWS
jgi:hypothetical protein